MGDELPHFSIQANGVVSQQCIRMGWHQFAEAATWVRSLPYGRNSSFSPEALFLEQKGTCSTKHAWLAQLAEEHNIQHGLSIGLFMMNGENTPLLNSFLKNAGIKEIPEVHSYLKHGQLRHDFTRIEMPLLFQEPIRIEKRMTVAQMSFKAKWHKEQMQMWIAEQTHALPTLAEYWEIREAAIAQLSQSQS